MLDFITHSYFCCKSAVCTWKEIWKIYECGTKTIYQLFSPPKNKQTKTTVESAGCTEAVCPALEPVAPLPVRAL